jgi:hypothetical protein
MKKLCCIVILLTAAVCAFAQTREDIRIFIPPVSAAPDQAAFFRENFTSETRGAGYTVTENAGEADYSLKLDVGPNMVLYDDGTEELAPDDEAQYVLNINLTRNEDDVVIISLFYPFAALEEMYDFNLYLLYQAMANVPLTKEIGAADRSTQWRNKWIYIRASIDYPITFYRLIPHNYYGPAIWNSEALNQNSKSINIDNNISPWIAATVGLEIQYLNWMSTEVNFNLSFKDPMGHAFIPTIFIEQKFPIKPSEQFMIEPYIAVTFPTNTSSKSKEFPKLGAGGGVQFGVRGGSMGAIFVDINYIYYFGDVVVANTNSTYKYPSTVSYNRFVVGLGLGYKIGFVNRD